MAEDEVELESDGDDLPPAAQVKAPPKPKKKAPLVKAVKVTTSKSNSEKEGRLLATQARGRRSKSQSNDEEQPTRRRSGRQPVATQTPAEAAKAKPRYPAESIVCFKMPSSSILWPCAVSSSSPPTPDSRPTDPLTH